MPIVRPDSLAILVGVPEAPEVPLPEPTPVGQRLRWALCDVWGRVLMPIEQRATGGFVQVDYDGRRTANLTISLFDAAAYRVKALSCVLKAWLDDRLIFAGPILTPTYNGAAGTVTLIAVNPVARLERQFLQTRYAPSVLPQGTLIQNLITQSEPTPAELGLGVPGLGIEMGVVEPGVNRARVYEQGQNVWSAITDIVGLVDGPIVFMEPLDRTDGILARCHITGSLGVDLQGVAFEFGWGRYNCLDFEWSPDGAQVNNRFTAEGPQPDPDFPTPTFTGNSVENQMGVGIYEGWETLSGASEEIDPTEWMQARAKQQIGAYAKPPDYFKVTPANEVLDEGLQKPPLVFGDYEMGDTADFIARHGALDVSIRGDIRGIKITEADAAGNLRTELTCVPAFGATPLS